MTEGRLRNAIYDVTAGRPDGRGAMMGLPEETSRGKAMEMCRDRVMASWGILKVARPSHKEEWQK